MRQSLLQWAMIALFGFGLAAVPLELSIVGALEALAFDAPSMTVAAIQRGPYPATPLDLEQLDLPGGW